MVMMMIMIDDDDNEYDDDDDYNDLLVSNDYDNYILYTILIVNESICNLFNLHVMICN
jgi:hypothetical protein